MAKHGWPCSMDAFHHSHRCFCKATIMPGMLYCPNCWSKVDSYCWVLCREDQQTLPDISQPTMPAGPVFPEETGQAWRMVAQNAIQAAIAEAASASSSAKRTASPGDVAGITPAGKRRSGQSGTGTTAGAVQAMNRQPLMPRTTRWARRCQRQQRRLAQARILPLTYSNSPLRK